MKIKFKIEEIKKGLEATKEYVFHPIASLFHSKKISNNKELTEYVKKESAKVTQQTLYEYVRNRMGTLYVKMHDDQKFIDSLNIATWNIYTIALQDLTLFSHSIIENSYNKDFSNLELENFYKTILDSEIENGLKQELLDEKIKEMVNVDRPVIFDCLVDKEENCFPMIPSGKPHNQMLLGPNDQKENKITGKGKTLV